MNKFDVTKESLLALGIFELRDFAREVGVKSPTSLNKASLIEKILALKEGQIEPESHSGRGRPRKPYGSAMQSGKTDEYPDQRDSAAVQAAEPVGASFKAAPDREREEGREPGAAARYGAREEMREQADEREGIVEIHADGFGFVRVKNYEASENDAYLSNQLIRKLNIRRGDKVKGQVRRQREDKYVAMFNVSEINGLPTGALGRRYNFDDLTPIYPDRRFNLELPGNRHDIAIRSIDLIAPIGKGQRAMIVSPPKAGKTTILKKVANSIAKNHPEAHLLVLLIDERPEEVTDMQRSITTGEVVFSTFDEMPEHHTRVAELVLNRAKRMVEMGRDVVILLDSLTRLARAYNLTVPPTGRTLSGGIDPGALHPPKRFFGSARNIENGGSLTIIATALVDTGSRMDEVIYEEFKGTGNMEIHLDRRLSEKRIFPAIDLNKSSTRREDLLLTQKELEGIFSIRKILSVGDTQEATEQLITMMLKTNNNMEFIDNLQLWLRSLK